MEGGHWEGVADRGCRGGSEEGGFEGEKGEGQGGDELRGGRF